MADDIVVSGIDLDVSKRGSIVDNQIKNMKGRNAGGAIEFLNKEWKTLSDDIDKSVTNDEQRLAAKLLLDDKYATIFNLAQTHIFNEMRDYDKQQTESLLAVKRNEAALNYTNRDILKKSLESQERAIREQKDREGAPDAEIIEAVAKARSATHREMMRRMLVDNQPEEAKAYDKEYGKEIIDDDLRILEMVRKESEVDNAKALEAQKDFLYKGIFDGTIGPDALEQANLPPKLAKFARMTLEQSWNDPFISDEKKEKVIADLLRKASDLGAEFDENGVLRDDVVLDDQNVVTRFKDEVVSNRRYLSPEFGRNLIDSVQSKMNVHTRSWWSNLMKSVLTMTGHLSPSGKLIEPKNPAKTKVLVDATNKAIQSAITNPDHARRQSVADEIKRDVNMAIRPEFGGYKKGQILPAGTVIGNVKTVEPATVVDIVNGEPVIRIGIHKVGAKE